MKLLKKNLNDIEKLGIKTPAYDIDKVKQNTLNNPEWLHFGPGNIFRVFIGGAVQRAIENNQMDKGIIAVSTFDTEIVDKAYRPFDNLTLSVIMKSTGELEKSVIGSIVDSVTINEYERLAELFENDSLQIASFTITEKGYQLKDNKGEFFPFVVNDFNNEPEKAKHTMSIVTALLYKRYLKNGTALTLLSMDNCSHNGDKIKTAVKIIADKWVENGYCDAGFADYVQNKITYPLSMIDKITPRPNESVKAALEKLGLEDMDTIITLKNTYTAPFVNAEEAEYLIMEDNFANGRPDFAGGNVMFTDRETVNKVETMKVTTCLNPLHTALAIAGCLLNFEYISDEVQDETLLKLINKIGYDEGLKVVVDPKIINPKDFIDEVINVRFANPFVKDTPQRIATDTSQKVGIRFGETIKKYVKSDELDAKSLIGIPLAIACWLRYLMGTDDKGNAMGISPDPMLDELKITMDKISLGDSDFDIKPILSNEKIFGIDLYDAGLGEKIEIYFGEMIAGTGMVKKTLDKYL